MFAQFYMYNYSNYDKKIMGYQVKSPKGETSPILDWDDLSNFVTQNNLTFEIIKKKIDEGREKFTHKGFKFQRQTFTETIEYTDVPDDVKITGDFFINVLRAYYKEKIKKDKELRQNYRLIYAYIDVSGKSYKKEFTNGQIKQFFNKKLDLSQFDISDFGFELITEKDQEFVETLNVKNSNAEDLFILKSKLYPNAYIDIRFSPINFYNKVKNLLGTLSKQSKFVYLEDYLTVKLEVSFLGETKFIDYKFRYPSVSLIDDDKEEQIQKFKEFEKFVQEGIDKLFKEIFKEVTVIEWNDESIDLERPRFSKDNKYNRRIKLF